MTPTQDSLAHGGDGHGGPLMATRSKAISHGCSTYLTYHRRGSCVNGVQWRSVHRAPPPLATRPQNRDFRDRHQSIDVLVPLERGARQVFLGSGVANLLLTR